MLSLEKQPNEHQKHLENPIKCLVDSAVIAPIPFKTDGIMNMRFNSLVKFLDNLVFPGKEKACKRLSITHWMNFELKCGQDISFYYDDSVQFPYV